MVNSAVSWLLPVLSAGAAASLGLSLQWKMAPPLKALHLVLFSDKLAIGPCIIDQRGLHLPRKGIAAKIAAMPGYEGGELEPFADKLGPAHASKPSMGHAATVPSPQM